MDIQMLLIPHQLKSYSQILTIACDVEQGLEKKNRNQLQNKPMKRPFPQVNRENPVRSISAPLAKRPFQLPPQQLVCGYCQKLRHNQRNCSMVNRLCLACEFGNHSVGDYPFKKTWNVAPTPPALPA